MRPLAYYHVLPGSAFDEPSLKNVFIYDPGKADTLLKQAGLTKVLTEYTPKVERNSACLLRPPTELTVSTRCRLSSNSTSRLVST